MWQDKNVRKEHIEEGNCQGGLQQENYSDSQTNSTTKNTGEDQKETRDSGKENDQGEEKWK